MARRHPRPTLFPYTTLFRSRELHAVEFLQLVAETEGPERLEAAARDLHREQPGVVRARIVLAERMLERGEIRSEEHASELQSRLHLVCRLLLEKKKKTTGPS